MRLLALALILAAPPSEADLRAKLVRYLPECGGTVLGDLKLDDCRDAERMIGHTPPRATTFFAAHWSRVAFGMAAEVEPDGIHLHPAGKTGGGAVRALASAPLQDTSWTPTSDRAADVAGGTAAVASSFASIGQTIGKSRARAELKEEGRILVRALDQLYAETDDPYCRRMRAALASLDLADEASFERFLAADAEALGTTVEALTAPPR